MTPLAHLELQRKVTTQLNTDPADLVRAGRTPERREAVLAMLSRCAQESADTHQLFCESGRLAASVLQGDYFFVAEARRDDRPITLHWSPHTAPQSTLEVNKHELDRERPDRSAVSFALQARHPIVVADLDDEDRFQDEVLQQIGARCGIVCPVVYAERVYGALGVCVASERAYEEEDVLFIQSLTLLLGPVIAHQQAERELVQQTKFLASTIDSLDSMVFLLSADGHILRSNRCCQQQSGFEHHELKGRHFWSAFLLPEEVELVRQACAQLQHNGSSVKCETFLLPKSGERRRMAWSFSRLSGQEERGPAIVASGVDITEQHRAIAELERYEAAARRSPDEGQGPAVRPSETPQRNAESGGQGQQAINPQVRERRSHRRRPYFYIQSIGPIRHGKQPRTDQFYEVKCCDISPRGFSFITTTAPNFRELVVAFGSQPARLHLEARVVHVSASRHEGQKVLMVGCEYTGRVPD